MLPVHRWWCLIDTWTSALTSEWDGGANYISSKLGVEMDGVLGWEVIGVVVLGCFRCKCGAPRRNGTGCGEDKNSGKAQTSARWELVRI